MNVQRSPTGSGTFSARSGSYPDLASKTVSQDASDISQITFRNKRKFDNDQDEIISELAEMKKQMTSMQNQISEIIKYLPTINENFKKLSEDVSDIKQQIKDIKSTTDTLTEEQAKLKLDIDNLKKSSEITEKRIETIESNFQSEDPCLLNLSATLTVREEIVNELNERSLRSKNIILFGVPEPKSNNPNERREEDKNAVLKIIKTVLCKDFSEPEKIYRLGKYQSDKNRHLKVCFATQETAKAILKNKQNLKDDNIKIFSDQTPQQQEYMKILKQKLEHRKSSGEENLCIKYIRGVPKIIKQIPKNSSQQYL